MFNIPASRLSLLDSIDWVALAFLGGVLPSTLFPELLDQKSAKGAWTPGANILLLAQKKILYSLLVPRLPSGGFDFVLYRDWGRVMCLTDDALERLSEPIRKYYAA